MTSQEYKLFLKNLEVIFDVSVVQTFSWKSNFWYLSSTDFFLQKLLEVIFDISVLQTFLEKFLEVILEVSVLQTFLEKFLEIILEVSIPSKDFLNNFLKEFRRYQGCKLCGKIFWSNFKGFSSIDISWIIFSSSLKGLSITNLAGKIYWVSSCGLNAKNVAGYIFKVHISSEKIFWISSGNFIMLLTLLETFFNKYFRWSQCYELL